MNTIETKALWRGGIAALAALAVAAMSSPSRADDDTAGAGVARISLISGTVSMQHGDSTDVFAAVINAPLSVGDYVTTASGDARAEVQLDDSSFLRVAPATQLRFTQLGSSDDALQLAAGTVEVSELAKSDAQPQVDTPSIGVRPDVAGRYRISVTSDGETFVTVRSGRADLVSPDGSQSIGAGTTVIVNGPQTSPHITPTGYVTADSFDQWNAQRDSYLRQAADGPYADSGMVGMADLDQYGRWVNDPDYGQVWVASSQPAGWAPYHTGRWVWQPYYGWTWVAYEPWGWAPYHYGRWFYAANYGWAWYPGPVYARPVWRPALVTFFGFSGGGGSGFAFNLSFGNVGWVPLAPREVYHPWWGPQFVNRTTIVYNTTNITNVNITRVYRNASAPGGVVAVSSANFTSGEPYHYVPIHTEDLHSVSLVKSALPVVPSRANLGYAKLPPSQLARVAPVSPRFATLPAPKQPPTFEQQRTAVQTTTKQLYPTMYGGQAAHGGSSSPWNRFGSEAPQGSKPGTAGGVMHPTSSNDWKYAPGKNPYVNQPAGAQQKSKTHHNTKTGTSHSGSVVHSGNQGGGSSKPG